MRFSIGIFAALFSLLSFSVMPALALSPDEVLVIANRNAANSVGLATWYMKKRQIPKENLQLVFVTDKETCSRDEYLQKIAPPGPPRPGNESETQRHCYHVWSSIKNCFTRADKRRTNLDGSIDSAEGKFRYPERKKREVN